MVIDKFQYLWRKSSVALMSRKQISEWPMKKLLLISQNNFDFCCDLFDKLFCNNLSSRGFKKNIKVFLNPWYEEIPIPETRTIRKSYISKLTVTFEEKIRSKFSILAHRMAFKITANLNLVIFRLENGLEWRLFATHDITISSFISFNEFIFSQLRCFLNNREPTNLMFVSP